MDDDYISEDQYELDIGEHPHKKSSFACQECGGKLVPNEEAHYACDSCGLVANFVVESQDGEAVLAASNRRVAGDINFVRSRIRVDRPGETPSKERPGCGGSGGAAADLNREPTWEEVVFQFQALLREQAEVLVRQHGAANGRQHVVAENLLHRGVQDARAVHHAKELSGVSRVKDRHA